MKLPVSELSVPSAAGNLPGRDKRGWPRRVTKTVQENTHSQVEAVFETLCTPTSHFK